MASANEKIRKCPICRIPSAADCLIGSLASNHHKQEGRQFQLAYCKCGDLIYLSPAPDLSDIRAMYADSRQFDEAEVYRGDHVVAADDFFIGRLRFLLESMQSPESRPVRILEVGAGLSWMCRAAKILNPDHLTVAQDITSEALQECEWVDHYHVVDITKPSAIDSHAPYDVISLTHVIEHLLDPVDVLKRLRELIAPTGRIFITAPHRPVGWKRGSDIAIWRDWSYNHVPAHVQYFSRGSLDKAARRAGLELTHWSEDQEEGQAFEACLQPVCWSRLPWRDVIGKGGVMVLLAAVNPVLRNVARRTEFLGKKVRPLESPGAQEHSPVGRQHIENQLESLGRAPVAAPSAPPDVHSRARTRRSPHPLVEGARIVGVRLLDSQGNERLKVHSGEETVIQVSIECLRPLSSPVIGLRIQRLAGAHHTVMYDTNTLWRNQNTGEFSRGDVIVARFCQRMSLGPGRHTTTVAIASHDAREFYDWQEEIVCFEVEASSEMQGVVNLGSEIEIGQRPIHSQRTKSGPFTLQIDTRKEIKVLNQDNSECLNTCPARRGSAIQIFLSGTGDTLPSWPAGEPAPANGNPLLHTRLRPAVTIGGIPARVLFSGRAPGSASVLQFNAIVPLDVSPGPAVPLAITLEDGVPRQIATIGIA